MTNTRTVRVAAYVGTDRRSQPEVSLEVTPGDIEWTPLAHEPDAVDAAQTLGELFANLDRMPHKRLTKEEVDRYLAEERASWD